MELSNGEKIKIIAKRQNIGMKQLAEMLGISSQNLSNQLRRDDFKESFLKEVADKLGCEYISFFEFEDGERF